MLICTGGAAGLYRPSNPGMASHRMWYSPFNTGAGLAMGIRAGAEMTSFEFRFIPLRVKDAIAPTGEIAQWLGAPQINALGEQYLDKYYAHLGGSSMTTQDRLYATMLEKRAGRGPCYLDLRGVNPKRLEGTIAAYLSMAPAGAIILSDEAYYARKDGELGAGRDHRRRAARGRRTRPVRLLDRRQAPHHPARLVGCGRRGRRLAEEVRVRCVGRGRARGARHDREARAPRRASRAAPDARAESSASARACSRPCTPRADMPPHELEERLQKLMDEYAGGISASTATPRASCASRACTCSASSKSCPRCARDTPFELMQCHEVIDRVEVARTLVEHMSHRRETRWHCYQERLDYPERDDARWMVFVNSVREADGSFRMIEHPVERAKIDVQLPPLADGAVIRGRRRAREQLGSKTLMGIHVDEQVCNRCGTADEPMCVRDCPGDLMLIKPNNKAAIIDNRECWDCAACVKVCPTQAIHMQLPAEPGRQRRRAARPRAQAQDRLAHPPARRPRKELRDAQHGQPRSPPALIA